MPTGFVEAGVEIFGLTRRFVDQRLEAALTGDDDFLYRAGALLGPHDDLLRGNSRSRLGGGHAFLCQSGHGAEQRETERENGL